VVETVRRALATGSAIADAVFDALYPDELRPLSREHWTPIEVALRAASMLAPVPGQRILDVGAGVGKLCLTGALSRPAQWYGIERDRSQVRAASDAARRLGITENTFFLHGDLDSVDWRRFDGFYLYNPAGSLLLDAPHASALERLAMVGPVVERIATRLDRVRPGTRVVTYHGFGGRMPRGYDLVESARFGEGFLNLWVKAWPRPRRPLPDEESLAA
jgi:hypothetical protein